MIKRTTYIVIIYSLIFTTGILAQNYNQVGYLSKSVKRIFLSKKYENKSFTVLDDHGKIMFASSINACNYWDYSGSTVCIADFSDVQQEGNYTLKIEGNSEVIGFSINNEIYKNIGKDAVKMFYHARASMPVEKQYGGRYARLAGHPDTKVYIHSSAASLKRPEGFVISSPGGWYDAGDYNKYIVNSAISTYTLLHLADLYKAEIKDVSINIPESKNEVSDILDETLYNLRWMLTMQDPDDGGVYHKLTTKNFCGMKMPHKDDLPRFVVMKSTAATLDFAATMAKASRVLRTYKKSFPGLADSCLRAAGYAWEWSINNPDILYVQPKDITTGEYKDKSISDEWLWAASELYLSTFNDKYKDKIDLSSVRFNIPQWGTVATLSLYSLISSPEADENLVSIATNKLLRLADIYYQQYQKSAYKVSIIKFPWGSNGELSNQGMLFMQAYKITKDKKYLEAADACLGYLLGANPTGYCFVTGYGNKSPLHIHERRSVSDGIEEPIPGFLVGGPTLQAPQDCGKQNYPKEYPAIAYLDQECSYSTNEIAINWNAPFVFLLWSLDAEINK